MPHSNLDYETPRKPAETEWLGPVACMIGAAAMLIPMLSLFPMLTVPAGSSVRPMGQTLLMFLGAGVGVAIVLPMALISVGVSLRKQRSCRWGIWGLMSALLAVFLNPMLFVGALKLRGLILAD